MKRKSTLIAFSIVFAGIFYASLNNNAFTNPEGAPIRTSGSPVDGNGTCANSGCHTGIQVTNKTNLLTSNIPAEGYTPGTKYTITAKTNSAVNRTVFGFQASPQSTTGSLLGTMTITNPTETRLVGSGKYITHTASGITGANGQKSWSFDWTAPAAGSGTVTFYACFNNANGNGGTSGDSIIRSNLVIQEKVVSNVNVDKLSSLGFNVYPMPVVSKLNIDNNHKVYVESLQIFDLNGRLVLNRELETDGNIKIDLSELNAGTYIVNISANGKSIATTRIVK